ncbi:MAG: outer membrane protein insertion porin family [Mariniblastus sp.]|jgi:outer membrane protein insertion porin family
MDQTLTQIKQNHFVRLDSQGNRRHSGVVVSILLFATAVMCGSQVGCQTPSLGKTAIPVPARFLDRASLGDASLDKSSLDNARFQSPEPQDGSGSRNRVLGVQSAANQQAPEDKSKTVAKVIVRGNKTVPTHHLMRNIRTRPGRFFDPDKLQQDVDELWRMPEVSRINGPFLNHTAEGVVVTIEVVERNTITTVEFIGNRGIPDRTLKKELGVEDGAPLDVHAIRMGKTKLEEFYKEKGYPRTQVEIMEGNETGDAKVVFLIHEDEKQRIWKTEFEGNTIASDARLLHFIESKPGILKVVGGLVKRDEIEQDIVRLTSYYRSLGFFNARIGREVNESNDGRWLTIRFIINEGPRYRVRNVAFIGNSVYSSADLESMLSLKPGAETGQPEFNVARMNEDVVALRDLYGSEGFVYSNVVAEPRFLEEPGLLDIVYKIEEGEQYVVGNINIHFEGDFGITKRKVVWDRMTLKPGDLIDLSRLKQSERLLGQAQVFATRQTPGGKPPQIVVRSPDIDELQRQARQSGGSSFR